MLKRQLYVLSSCLFCTAVLVSCSSDKVLPSGKRISVLDQHDKIQVDNLPAAKGIKVPAAVSNNAWLQNDMNAAHITKNIQAGIDFQRQWRAGFGTGSSKREFLVSKPLMKDNVVYTLDADGVLSAFKLSDGEKIWSLEIESENKRVNATALKGIGLAIDGDNIYVTTGFGVVVSVNLKTQKKNWEQNLKSPLRIAPVVAKDKVFIQSVDNKFFALDVSNGEILWQYDIAMESTTMVGGSQAAYDSVSNMVIIGFSNGEVQAFDASLGVPFWTDVLIANKRAYSSTFLHTMKASPVIENGRAYVLGNAGVSVAIDLQTGERIWEKEISGASTPLLLGNTLYAVTDNKQLVALNKENGDVLWASDIMGEGIDKEAVAFAPIMLNSRLIVALSDGHVIAYDPLTGKAVKTVDLDENLNSAPVAANGYVLFTTSKAKLLVYK